MNDSQSAIIETPISPSDLLDTVHASLSALTTLIPLSPESALQNLGDMAQALTEIKAPTYIRLLPSPSQPTATLSLALDRAVFVAAYANAQFEARQLDLSTYLSRLDESFSVPEKESSASMLCAEADARMELVLSTIDLSTNDPLPAAQCWKILSTAQDLYTTASKLTTEDAKERKPDLYKSKGDVELLRLRLATLPSSDLGESMKKSGATLVKNAQTFYKGAVEYAKGAGDEDVEDEAMGRWVVAGEIKRVLYGGVEVGGGEEGKEALMECLEGCVEEGIVGRELAGRIIEGDGGDGAGVGGSSSRG